MSAHTAWLSKVGLSYLSIRSIRFVDTPCQIQSRARVLVARLVAVAFDAAVDAAVDAALDADGEDDDEDEAEAEAQAQAARVVAAYGSS